MVLYTVISKGNEKNYTLALNDKLVELNNMTREYYVVGDFNIDVNTSAISNNCGLFLNMLNSNGITHR